ncbi:hypothetical protein IAD21_06040 [Abditibacteriota bacterium]|nr:hypothetical protein IAD21_06040 [Abditibacteriota bacterium]
MSGKKCSSVSLDVERQARANALAQIESETRRISGLMQQVMSRLEDLSPRLVDQFPAEVQSAQNWLRRVHSDIARHKSWQLTDERPTLEGAVHQLNILAREGSNILSGVTEAKKSVDRLQRNAQMKLQELDAVLMVQQDILEHWFPEDIRTLRKSLSEIGRLHQNDEFRAVQEQLPLIESDFKIAVGRARSLEDEYNRQNAAVSLTRLWRDLQTQQAIAKSVLENASEGLRVTFWQEVENAERWDLFAEIESSRLATIGKEAKIEDIQAAHSILKPLLERGKDVCVGLEQAFVERATQLRNAAQETLVPLEEKLKGAQNMLTSWFGAEETARLSSELEDVTNLLQRDRFLEFDAPVRALNLELEKRLNQAKEQADKHITRLYLLKALRHLCSGKGFKEVRPPSYERQGDISSRIILIVDTLDQGPITYFLSLEDIQADSCISHSYCFHEFDQLSDKLSKDFGINTHFEMADGTPRPELKQRGEQDEPEFWGREASA